VLPTSQTYRTVLPTPHKRFFTLDVTDIDGVSRAVDVRPLTGEVTASLVQRVTRSANFALPDEWYPATSDDPLSPEFAVVHIRAGIQYGNGLTETFPIFTGRVDTATRTAQGTVNFECFDLANDVLNYRFESPRTTTQATTLAEIRSLISEALPQAVYGTDDVADTPTPSLTWDEDRGDALDDLASSVGGRWYTLGDGSFVVRSFSYTPGTPVATYTDGPQGMVTAAEIARSRSGAFNSVVVVSERTDGSAPVRIPARVTNPADPLYFGGRYGKVSEIVKVQTPITVTQAQHLATTQLAASAALREQWAVNITPDMALEPGDTVDLGYRGRTGQQIVDQITYPLDHKVDMSLVCRAGIEVQ
jgi:hypothetical protein